MITKINKLFIGGLVGCVFCAATTSCSDFFDQESDAVLYADQSHLDNAVDTIYSVTGILNKLQVIADRTILLGEVRGDLVNLTNDASSDLRDMALFNMSDSNMYNVPRDYYAIINNCNYFIANVDTALISAQNELIFMKEYAAVKAIRAWTYLQLVLNYGRVPFVIKPILNKDDAEQNFEMYDLEQVCRFFIDDLNAIPAEYNIQYPGYRNIRNTVSGLFYFPLSILRGDLYLWLGSITHQKEYYKQSALHYYTYIKERNGESVAYPTGATFRMWAPGTSQWLRPALTSGLGITFGFGSEVRNATSELITMIPGDSIRAEGYYSELRNLFNSTEENGWKHSITPSEGLVQLSGSQYNCVLSTVKSDGSVTVSYVPFGLTKYRSGDLRLWQVMTEGTVTNTITGLQMDYQEISKHSSRNVHIYRRQMVYLRMAEALNLAGYPRMAFSILSTGLTNDVRNSFVFGHCSKEDSVYLRQFDFPITRYEIITVEDINSLKYGEHHNTLGIHSRGSGWTPKNEYYQLPDDPLQTDSLLRVAYQMAGVDSLILNEGALEFAFEGVRFYDLMRFALRSDNPGQFMAKHVYGRRGESMRSVVESEIKKPLTDPKNWYLKWNGKIGF